MENKTNIWELFEKAENKTLFLKMLSSALEKPVLGEIVKLSSLRQLTAMIEFKPGFLSVFENPSNCSDAFAVQQDHTIGKADIKKDKILAPDIEICITVPLTKNTAEALTSLLAEKLVQEENKLYQKLLLAATDAKVTPEKPLFGVRQPPAIVPAADGSDIRFIAFELISMVLPIKEASTQEVL